MVTLLCGGFREHKIDFVRHEVSVYLVLKYISDSEIHHVLS